jgi:L-fuconolactonase
VGGIGAVTGWVDAHHHVWDLGVRDQPWITGADMAPLRRDFAIDDLAVDAHAVGIESTVVVMTVADIAETEELLDLAAATPSIAGVVGYVDLEADDVADELDRLRATPSGRGLVGIRSLVQGEPDREWLRRPAVLRGLRAVADRGLVFDLLVRADQLPSAVAAVDAVEEGRFVLDHLAKPNIASGDWEPWATELATLAERPNVAAKLSGLVTEADWTTWTAADLQPYTHHALAAFGPRRLLFGSDWPVCTLAATYAEVVSAAVQLLDELTEPDQSLVMGGNARNWYRLDEMAPRREEVG